MPDDTPKQYSSGDKWTPPPWKDIQGREPPSAEASARFREVMAEMREVTIEMRPATYEDLLQLANDWYWAEHPHEAN